MPIRFDGHHRRTHGLLLTNERVIDIRYSTVRKGDINGALAGMRNRVRVNYLAQHADFIKISGDVSYKRFAQRFNTKRQVQKDPVRFFVLSFILSRILDCNAIIRLKLFFFCFFAFSY